MTKFHGILLFDVIEEPIGRWENQLGYRGMMEVWKVDKRNVLTIEPLDDWCANCEEEGRDCECWEIWIADDEQGVFDTLGVYPSFEVADTKAKQIMTEFPNGYW